MSVSDFRYLFIYMRYYNPQINKYIDTDDYPLDENTSMRMRYKLRNGDTLEYATCDYDEPHYDTPYFSLYDANNQLILKYGTYVTVGHLLHNHTDLKYGVLYEFLTIWHPIVRYDIRRTKDRMSSLNGVWDEWQALNV